MRPLRELKRASPEMARFLESEPVTAMKTAHEDLKPSVCASWWHCQASIWNGQCIKEAARDTAEDRAEELAQRAKERFLETAEQARAMVSGKLNVPRKC